MQKHASEHYNTIYNAYTFSELLISHNSFDFNRCCVYNLNKFHIFTFALVDMEIYNDNTVIYLKSNHNVRIPYYLFILFAPNSGDILAQIYVIYFPSKSHCLFYIRANVVNILIFLRVTKLTRRVHCGICTILPLAKYLLVDHTVNLHMCYK